MLGKIHNSGDSIASIFSTEGSLTVIFVGPVNVSCSPPCWVVMAQTVKADRSHCMRCLPAPIIVSQSALPGCYSPVDLSLFSNPARSIFTILTITSE